MKLFYIEIYDLLCAKVELKYSEQEKQAINLYYEKLNKSKSNDDVQEEPKNKDGLDSSDENIEEAVNNLLKILEDNEVKHWLALS